MRRGALAVSVSIATRKVAILAFAKNWQWQRALGLLNEMTTQGLRADVITHNASISACGRGRQWQRALGLFAEMGRRPNMVKK